MMPEPQRQPERRNVSSPLGFGFQPGAGPQPAAEPCLRLGHVAFVIRLAQQEGQMTEAQAELLAELETLEQRFGPFLPADEILRMSGPMPTHCGACGKPL